MFGKRGNDGFGKGGAGIGTIPAQPAAAAPAARSSTLIEPGSPEASNRQQVTPPSMQTPSRKKPPRTEDYYDTKSQVFSALIDTIDLSQLAKLDGESAREEIMNELNRLVLHHADALVREAAVAALGAIGDESGLAAILSACQDKPAIRRRAVLALAPFDSPEVEMALKVALEDRDWQVRQAAEDLLG